LQLKDCQQQFGANNGTSYTRQVIRGKTPTSCVIVFYNT